MSVQALLRGQKCVKIHTAITFAIGRTLAYESIIQVISCLQRSKTIIFPNDLNKLQEISNAFESIAGFPNVYGAIDGCIVMIHRFHNSDGWYCTKGFPALNVMAMVDNNKRFTSYSIRPGSQNDRMMYKNSQLYKNLQLSKDGYILADAGYTLSSKMLTPYPIHAFTRDDEEKFILTHSRTRIVVEQAFGL
ncbi:hypothetical protein THRCLA_22890 [Thraustotheca clavata]|uniref:DDE Tnp4 domain-containing protein n=1 Tax=Thraustotheca clavata TaxID=74557 RepID=A0A1V9YRS4_9STRA|nr:hypothetical protein THRCLA_22890 [Thraustotheca clavata]